MSKKDTKNLASYLKWGLLGALILSIPGWLVARLRTMGPEYVRQLEPTDFIPLIILVSIGFLASCTLNWINDRARKSK